MPFDSSRPNYALICIGVVFLSFSFIGQVLVSENNTEGFTLKKPLANKGKESKTFQDLTNILDSSLLLPAIISNTQDPIALSASYEAEGPANNLKVKQESSLTISEKILLEDENSISTPIAQKHNYEDVKTYQYQPSRPLRAVTASANNKKPINVQRAKRTILAKELPAQKPILVVMEITSKENSAIHTLIVKDLMEDYAVKVDNKIASKTEGIEAEILASIHKADREHKEIIFDDEKDLGYQKDIISFLKELYLQEKSSKVAILSKMTPQEIARVKETLNAHNISLRAFIKSPTKKSSKQD